MEQDAPSQHSTNTDFARLEQKIDAIYVSVEKTRKYFLYSLLVTVAVVVLPVIGLMFAIPTFLGTYTSLENSNLLQGL